MSVCHLSAWLMTWMVGHAQGMLWAQAADLTVAIEQVVQQTIPAVVHIEMTAGLVGPDAKTDLAVLKIDAKEALPFVTCGDSEQMAVGQWVVAIGHHQCQASARYYRAQ